MSVRLSLCGGSRTGAEGCRMHQNMCVPAALMACRRSEKAIPSSVPAASSFLKDLPPNIPFLTSGPCTSSGPLLALPLPLPVPLGKPLLSGYRLHHLCYEWTVSEALPVLRS